MTGPVVTGPVVTGPVATLGVGFASACPVEELLALARAVVAEGAAPPPTRIATVADRDSGQLEAVAEALGAEPVYLPPADLAPWQTPTRSTRSRAATGVDSVAEAAALAAAGPGARLTVARRTSRRGSCALAVVATDPIATESKEHPT